MVARYPGAAALIAYAKKPFKKIPDPSRALTSFFVGGRSKSQLRLRWAKETDPGWRNFFLPC